MCLRVDYGGTGRGRGREEGKEDWGACEHVNLVLEARAKATLPCNRRPVARSQDPLPGKQHAHARLALGAGGGGQRAAGGGGAVSV